MRPWFFALFLMSLMLASTCHAATKKPAPQAPQLTWDFLHLFTNADGSRKDPINDAAHALSTFTVDDLTAAKADADAQTPPDTVASNCYAALLPLVAKTATNPLPTKLGGFLLLQKARDLANNSSAALESIQQGAVNTACAPLVMSSANTIMALQARALGAAAAAAILVPKL